MPDEEVPAVTRPAYLQNDRAEFVDMMDDLLSDTSVRSRGLFRPEAVAALRKSMHQREFLLGKQAFSLMVLELWFRTFVDAGGRSPA